MKIMHTIAIFLFLTSCTHQNNTNPLLNENKVINSNDEEITAIENELQLLENESNRLYEKEYHTFNALSMSEKCEIAINQLSIIDKELNKPSIDSNKPLDVGAISLIHNHASNCIKHCENINNENQNLCILFSATFNQFISDIFLDAQYKFASTLCGNNLGPGCLSKFIIDMRLSNKMVCGKEGSLSKSEKILKLECLKYAINCASYKTLNQLKNVYKIDCKDSQ